MGKEKLLDLFEHIGELRKRLIRIIAVFIVSTIAGLFLSDKVINYLKNAPPASTMNWNAFSLWDGIRLYMNVALIFSFIISLPFIMFQIWGFVKPGLHIKEQKATVRYIPFALIMLLVGLLFSYYVVFPMAVHFTSMMNNRLGLIQTYGISQYFGFMTSIVIPVSIAFELPVVVLFLTKLRILNPMLLKKMRRYAYLILVIIAAMISPPDIVSHSLVAVPLLVLYEISVSISRYVYKKQVESDRAFEAELT